VKAARAVLSTTPGLAETIVRDWRKAARFYARFGITEGEFRLGVPPEEGAGVDERETHQSSGDWMSEVRQRESAAFSDSGPSVYAPARL
jgi:hypothetical protein